MLRSVGGYRQASTFGGGQTSVHGEIADERVEVAPRMDTLVFELLVKCVPAERVVGLYEHWEVGIIGHSLLTLGKALDTFHTLQRLTVTGINSCAASQDVMHVFELQQAEGGVDFAHLGIDTWGDDGGFIDEAEVFQMIDTLLSFGIRADDCATFKGVEDFGGVKAEYRQVSMT